MAFRVILFIMELSTQSLQAATYGDVIVGCLTDAAITEFKTLPILSFEQRARVLENIKGVSKVVAQEDWDYSVQSQSDKT